MDKISLLVPLVALATFGYASGAPQVSKQSVEEQLLKQYSYTNTSLDKQQIISAGSVLVLKVTGVSGAPGNSITYFHNNYRDGRMSHPKLANAAVLRTSKALQAGSKVDLLKIDWKEGKKEDTVTFQFVSDDLIEDVRYKGLLDFQFPPGTLASASLAELHKAFDGVFELDRGQPQEQAAGPGVRPAGPEVRPAETPAETFVPVAPPPPPVDAAPVAPKSIEVGQTPDQVVEAFGQPEKKIKLGKKEIYTYKDLKVTFINGKVSDVQ